MYLEVRSEEGIAIGLADQLGGLCAKHVVHDASALLEVMQPWQQRTNRCLHTNAIAISPIAPSRASEGLYIRVQRYDKSLSGQVT